MSKLPAIGVIAALIVAFSAVGASSTTSPQFPNEPTIKRLPVTTQKQPAKPARRFCAVSPRQVSGLQIAAVHRTMRHSASYCSVLWQRKVIPKISNEVRLRYAEHGIILKRDYQVSWNKAKLKRELRFWQHKGSKPIPKLAERFKRFAAWVCIHRHEGPWNDKGDPYWGGLQMDKPFMRAYGKDFMRIFKGALADKWTPAVQIVVAERAYKTRGFAPWPNTSRMCRLR